MRTSHRAALINGVSWTLLGLSLLTIGSVAQRVGKKLPPITTSNSTTSASIVPPAGIDPAYYYKVGGQYPGLFEDQGHIFSVILEPLMDNAATQRPRNELIRITDLSKNYPEGASFKLWGDQAAIVNGIRLDISFHERGDNWWMEIRSPKMKGQVSIPLVSLAQWQVEDATPDMYCGQRYLTRTSPVKFANDEMGASIMFWTPGAVNERSSDISAMSIGYDGQLLDPDYVFVTQDAPGHQLNAWKRLGDTKCGLYWDSGRQLFLPRAG